MVTHDEIQEVRGELRSEIQKSKLDILDSMDEKMATLKGDLVIMMRKEDKKVSALIDLLEQKQVITQEEATGLLELRPFPQM